MKLLDWMLDTTNLFLIAFGAVYGLWGVAELFGAADPIQLSGWGGGLLIAYFVIKDGVRRRRQT